MLIHAREKAKTGARDVDSWGEVESGKPKQRLREVFNEVTFESRFDVGDRGSSGR